MTSHRTEEHRQLRAVARVFTQREVAPHQPDGWVVRSAQRIALKAQTCTNALGSTLHDEGTVIALGPLER